MLHTQCVFYIFVTEFVHIRLQEQELCHPIKQQKELNSALWLGQKADTAITGSCKNLEKHSIA